VAPSNKGMKLTRPERIGALQLISGVRRTQSGRAARPAAAPPDRWAWRYDMVKTEEW
jgi:hypothetical protein